MVRPSPPQVETGGWLAAPTPGGVPGRAQHRCRQGCASRWPVPPTVRARTRVRCRQSGRRGRKRESTAAVFRGGPLRQTVRAAGVEGGGKRGRGQPPAPPAVCASHGQRRINFRHRRRGGGNYVQVEAKRRGGTHNGRNDTVVGARARWPPSKPKAPQHTRAATSRMATTSQQGGNQRDVSGPRRPWVETTDSGSTWCTGQFPRQSETADPPAHARYAHPPF